MAFEVNNTTENGLIDVICPNFCMGCGRLGSLICESCKKNLRSEDGAVRAREAGGLFAYGERAGLLEMLVERYKYGPVRSAVKVLVGLMDEVLPEMNEVVIVPLPTIPRHVRERGFDHMWILGKKLARKRGWKCQKLLKRTNNSVQVGADAKTRKKQAKTAYKATQEIDNSKIYLLLDDVWTTGASMRAAEEQLRAAGGQKIYKAVVAISK